MTTSPAELDQGIADFECKLDEARREFNDQIEQLRRELGIARAHVRSVLHLAADCERPQRLN